MEPGGPGRSMEPGGTQDPPMYLPGYTVLPLGLTVLAVHAQLTDGVLKGYLGLYVQNHESRVPRGTQVASSTGSPGPPNPLPAS